MKTNTTPNPNDSPAVAAYKARIAAAAILKRRRRKWTLLIVGGVAVGIAATLLVLNLVFSSKPEMRVTFVRGEVIVVEADGTKREVVLGEMVEEGMTFETGEDAEVDIGMSGLGGTKVDARSRLKAERLRKKANGRLDLHFELIEGRSFHRFHHLPAGSEIGHKVATGQAWVRGTEFFLEVGAVGTLVAVREGTVAAASDADLSAETAVGAGFMATITSKAVTSPEPVGEREKELFKRIDEIHEDVPTVEVAIVEVLAPPILALAPGGGVWAFPPIIDNQPTPLNYGKEGSSSGLATFVVDRSILGQNQGKETSFEQKLNLRGLIAQNGYVIVDPTKGETLLQYNVPSDEIEALQNQQIILFKRNELWGVKDLSGKTLVEPIWEWASYEEGEKLIRFQLAEKWGIASVNGVVVLKPSYDEMGTFIHGIACARKGRFYGFLDNFGKEITAFSYTDARERWLMETEEFRVVQVNVGVKGRPYDTAGGFPHGPDSHENIYGQVRRFFSFLHPERGLGVVWQDTRDQSIQLNWLGKEFSAPAQHALANPGSQTLVAAAMDAGGNVYYFTVRSGTSGNGAGQRASLNKVDAEGKTLKTAGLDASAGGLDIKGFTRNSGSMAITGDRMGLIFSRTMFNGHQGAISLVFDTATLKQLKHHGQTSGHSFDSVLGVDTGGKFLGMDLGDNYPRGLHLHRFDEAGRRSALVYTFKTEHASEPKLIGSKKSAVYPEISRGGQTFYKWSNDNATYTELGGIAECEAGIAVVFAGEASHEGRALDNGRSLGRHFDPRNLGLVLVRKDFEAVPGEKGKAIPHGRILSEGKAESGGFYDFGGGWQALNNEGVVWLTDYKDRDRENASRVKLARLGDDSLIVFWEEWTPESYLRTRMMRISSKGERLSEPVDLGTGLRLGRREDPVVDGNRVLLVSGSSAGAQIHVHSIEWRKPLSEKTKIAE